MIVKFQDFSDVVYSNYILAISGLVDVSDELGIRETKFILAKGVKNSLVIFRRPCYLLILEFSDFDPSSCQREKHN